MAFIKSSFFISIILSILLNLTKSQIPHIGKCPDVEVVTDFNINKYLGKWYEYSKYPVAFEAGGKCIYAIYEAIDDESISIMNTKVNIFTKQRTNTTGNGKLIESGKLLVTFTNGPTRTNPNYLILDTDYTSYAVVYSCFTFRGFAGGEIAWILTRERNPSQSVIDKAYKAFDKNDLSKFFLMKTDHSCEDE